MTTKPAEAGAANAPARQGTIQRIPDGYEIEIAGEVHAIRLDAEVGWAVDTFEAESDSDADSIDSQSYPSLSEALNSVLPGGAELNAKAKSLRELETEAEDEFVKQVQRVLGCSRAKALSLENDLDDAPEADTDAGVNFAYGHLGGVRAAIAIVQAK